MLLHRGHGSILSGFFRVFSSDVLLVSFGSSFLLVLFGEGVSFSAPGVLGSSLTPDDVAEHINSSTCLVSLSSPPPEGF